MGVGWGWKAEAPQEGLPLLCSFKGPSAHVSRTGPRGPSVWLLFALQLIAWCWFLGDPDTGLDGESSLLISPGTGLRAGGGQPGSQDWRSRLQKVRVDPAEQGHDCRPE